MNGDIARKDLNKNGQSKISNGIPELTRNIYKMFWVV